MKDISNNKYFDLKSWEKPRTVTEMENVLQRIDVTDLVLMFVIFYLFFLSDHFTSVAKLLLKTNTNKFTH